MTRALLATALALTACGGPARTATPTGRAVLQIQSNVRDAHVYINGRFEAPLDVMRNGIAVRPGVHRIELRHEDYFSSYAEVNLQRAERKLVSLEMAPILP